MTPYRTPAATGETEFTERGSRFIGVCAPVTDEPEAKAFIDAIRTKHAEATHNVYAYRMIGGVSRCSDDGEPSGTAGSPVFEVLTRREVQNAVIVVTRYFGGTLLGAGGLIRAYARAASAALEVAGVVEMRPWREGAAAVPYAMYEQASRLLTACGVRDLEADFGAEVLMRFLILDEDWNNAADALRELTSGGTELIRGEVRYG